MFKLLNEIARENIEKEYSQRRAVVALVGLSIILIVGIVSLFPAYLISSTRLSEANLRTASVKRLPTSQDGFTLERWLADVNQKVLLFSRGADQTKPFEFFSQIISIKPKGISLSRFAWKVEDNNISLTIAGVASDRQALLDFEDSINNTKDFTKAAVPVSNFARYKDINFELTISPVKPEDK